MRFQFLSLAVLVAACSPGAADDAADAKAIIEKALKAGGQKPGDGPVAVTWKDKGTFTGGGVEMKYAGDWAFQGPDRYRFSVTGDFGGMKYTFSCVVNGEKAWVAAMGMVQEVTDDKLDYVLNQTYHLNVISLLPLATDKAFKLTPAGDKDVNGMKAVGVKVSRDKRPDITLYFDKASGLVVKSETKVKDEFQGWKEVPEEVFYSDYKDVSGKMYFTRMKVVRDGKTMMEAELSDQKAAERLDPKLFEKP